MYTTASPQHAVLPSRWVSATPKTRGPAVEAPAANVDLASGLKLVGMPLRQARLYLALTGSPRTARQASEVARIHRATAYRLLLRLLERGLIIGDGSNPQRFQSVAPEVILSRLERFLREEADLCSALSAAYGSWSAPAIPSAGSSPPGFQQAPVVLSRRKGESHPTLSALEECHQRLDVVLRPIACSVSLRNGLLRRLGGLLRQGVKIRLLLDAGPSDQRFVAALAREGGDRRNLLSYRHLAPVGAHYYVIDSRVVVRLPALGSSGPAPEIAVVDRDASRVHSHAERFERLWAESSEPLGAIRSTRSYAWKRTAARFATLPRRLAEQQGYESVPDPSSSVHEDFSPVAIADGGVF